MNLSLFRIDLRRPSLAIGLLLLSPASFAAPCPDNDLDGFDLCGNESSAPDCDDRNSLIHPGAEEICDGMDSDCDGAVGAEEQDYDGDGFATCAGDCDDGSHPVYPGAFEAPCDFIDNNCDGRIEDDPELCYEPETLDDLIREIDRWVGALRDAGLRSDLAGHLDIANTGLTEQDYRMAQIAFLDMSIRLDEPEGEQTEDPSVIAKLRHLARKGRTLVELKLGATAVGGLGPIDDWSEISSTCTGLIDGWYMNEPDRYIPGDFDGDGRDELLAISAVSQHAKLMQYNRITDDWETIWGNGGPDGNGQGWIDLWRIDPGSEDHYIAGDFDGDGADEVLAINPSGWAHLIQFTSGTFDWVWGNQSANPSIPTGMIGLWYINPNDRYIAGNFDGDPEDELMALSGAGWSQLMEWNGAGWSWFWGNGGSTTVAQWPIDTGNDHYFVDDFDDDGIDEFLAINNGAGRYHTMQYSGGGFTAQQAENDGQMGLWNMGSASKYAAGDFDKDGEAEIIAISHSSGYDHLIEYHRDDWRWRSGDGDGFVDSWPIGALNFLVAGDFNGDSGDELQMLSPQSETGCQTLLTYEGKDCIPAPHGMTAFFPFDAHRGTLVEELVAGNNGTASGGTWLSGTLRDFSLTSLPDTQNYALYRANYLDTGCTTPYVSDIFAQQTQWIADEALDKNGYNIVFNFGLGDIVQSGPLNPWPPPVCRTDVDNNREWNVARGAMDNLEGPFSCDPFVVPYAIVPGNHDGDYANDSYWQFDANFPVSDFSCRPWYHDSYPAGMQNNALFFEQGDLKLGIISLEMNPADSGAHQPLAWANNILANNSDRYFMVATHHYMHGQGTMTGNRATEGDVLWNKVLSQHKNVIQIHAGHSTGAAWKYDIGVDGHRVYEILADYQNVYNDGAWNGSDGDGGLGYLRVNTFSARSDGLNVDTYSPWCEATGNCDPDDPPWSGSQGWPQSSAFHDFTLPWTMAGKVDNALRLNGIDQRVEVADGPGIEFGTGDFTIEAWVSTDNEAAEQVILSKQASPNWPSDPGYRLSLVNGLPRFVMTDGGWQTQVTSPTTGFVADGLWHHIAVTVDRDSNGLSRIYVDGVAVTTIPVTPASGSIDNNVDLWIGQGQTPWSGEPFDGVIDELAMYERWLSSDEIDDIWSAGGHGRCKRCLDPAGSLVGWWPLDETLGSTAADLAKGNNGSWVGGPAAMDGRVGGSLNFSGNNWVTVPDSAALDIGVQDFGFGAWIQPTNLGGIKTLIDKRQWSGGNLFGYHVFLNNGQLGLQLADGSYTNYFVPTGLALTTDNKWHYVSVAVERGQGIRMSVDGVEYTVMTTAHTGSLSNSAPLLIGGHISSPSSRFVGQIDEVEIYNGALPDRLTCNNASGPFGVCK